MRLIDADAIEFAWFDGEWITTENHIDDMQTIDAVQVVRCKDCKYNDRFVDNNGFLVCSASNMEITDDDFCSYGEKKEETE